MTIAQQLKIKEFPFIIKDSEGNEIYHETSDGYWAKSEYDSESNRIYLEYSDGTIIDNRLKTDEQIINFLRLTLQEIAFENMKYESDREELLRCVSLAENALAVLDRHD